MDRRTFLSSLGAAAVGAAVGPALGSPTPQLRGSTLPGSGERIPAIGLGTWLTFNTLPFTDARQERTEVLRAFFEAGGTLVDSSPMYGMAEATLGDALERVDAPQLFSATKVWVPTRLAGIAQMNASAALWGLDGFDLMQVHNMVDWEAHLPTLREWKAEGRLRHIGITTSHGRRHQEMLGVIRNEPDFNFVQFSYNLSDREAEARLLPESAERGKSVLINRPFRTGGLFDSVRGLPLPGWAGELACTAWSQVFLKFVISHPAVTCAIPATRRVPHLRENMAALSGPMPDAALRRRMAADFDRLT